MRKVLGALAKEHVFSSGALAEFETVLGTLGGTDGADGSSGLPAMFSQEPDDFGGPALEAYR